MMSIHKLVSREIDAIAKDVLKGIFQQNDEELSNENPVEGGEKAVHSRVACDNCNAYPLIGARYKCSVCKNFDFCEKCEEKVSHPHAFIKLNSPDIFPVSIITAIDDDESPEQEQP